MCEALSSSPRIGEGGGRRGKGILGTEVQLGQVDTGDSQQPPEDWVSCGKTTGLEARTIKFQSRLPYCVALGIYLICTSFIKG
jgi:hypothetical protein